MSLCLTFFTRRVDATLLSNHAHYCRLYGYRHEWVTSDHIAHPHLRTGYKYSQILKHLRGLPADDWLLFLDDDSVIFRATPMEPLMQDRDLLVVDGPEAEGRPGRPLTNMIALRNTAANRALLHGLITDAGHVMALYMPCVDEAARLAPAGLLPCNTNIANIYVNISWRSYHWYHAHIFVVHLGPPTHLGADGVPIQYLLHDLNMQSFLTRQVNAALVNGQPVLAPAAYPALSDEATTCHNPGHRIAFVTLYGHDIHSYARVSEHNVKRYCERHGYSYHVYRGMPPELDAGMNGTWAKTWLLQQHLADYDWVIWIDADVIFFNHSKRIEPLLEGRDLLLAKDVTSWAMNAGVMGFRNTPRNADLLARIWARILEVQDKSGVYASQGDQYYINVLLGENDLIGEENVLDNLSINTPPHLATAESLLVHYVNLGEPYRSAYMADMDVLSLRSN